MTCSLLCYGATIYIYNATAPPSLVGGREPIAFVIHVANEVERRPIKRTIWQELDDADPVYPGEAIRTASQGTAKLQFKGNSKTLDIEPDSLIVLTKNKNDIALELLDGHVFVAQGEGEDTGENKLTLASDAGAVDLSKATVALSKSAGKSVDLQIVKGSAKIMKAGKVQEMKAGETSALSAAGPVLETATLQALAPRVEGPVYISMQNPSALSFEWEGEVANANYELWLGESRRNLKRLPSVQAARPGQILATVKPGRYYWKVVASSGKTVLAESAVQRLEVQALPAPSVIEPQNNERITLQSEGLPITFQWVAPDRVDEVTLEIASDGAFRNTLFTEKFEAKTTQVDRILPNGKYFWRLSALYPEEREMISSQPQNFEIWVVPPKVINITWDIEKSMSYPIEPKADLAWTATKDPDIKKWRVKVAPTEAQLSAEKGDQTLQFEVSDTKISPALPGPGRWIAAVEALDAEGRVISRSENRSFDLSLIPPVAGPTFLPEKGDLKADNKGDLTLTWRAPAGVRDFQLTLTGENGRPIASQKSSKTSVNLESLLPGTYRVDIKAIDQYGRPTENIKPRRVIVPKGSGLAAPKMKRIQVN